MSVSNGSHPSKCKSADGIAAGIAHAHDYVTWSLTWSLTATAT